MSILASVFLKTESSDEYHYLFTDIKNAADLVERVEGLMGPELAYVWSVDIVAECPMDVFLEEALEARISEMEEE